MERVMVGVDGSEHAERALRWAIEEARAHGAELTAVLVAERPSTYVSEVGEGQVMRDLDRAQRKLEEILDGAAEAGSDVSVEPLVTYGDARRVLRDLSEDTDHLVVGSRGHGEITGLVLGSVGQHLVTHAHCPVTVVRTDRGPREDGSSRRGG